MSNGLADPVSMPNGGAATQVEQGPEEKKELGKSPKNPNGASDPDSMTERLKRAFDFAADSTKQLITLSTGIVALTITFAKDIVGGFGPVLRAILAVSWLIYLLSMLFGCWTLLALTGTLEPKTAEDKKKAASIRGNNVTVPTFAQIGSFLLASLLIVLVAITGSCRPSVPSERVEILPKIAAVEYEVSATQPGVPRPDALLTLDAAGRYRWSTAQGQAAGTYAFDLSGTKLRMTGPLKAWGEGQLGGDKVLVFRALTPRGRQEILLRPRRWMCPLQPFC